MSCPSVDDPPSNSTLGGCKCSRGRMELYLPLALDFECDWPAPVRAILYLALLAWCFLGVAIIANIFMEAIETITAKKKTKIRDGKEIQVLIWNPTVANLTLMALGSSAPEILLSVIEILLGKFEAGALGPGTILGSAAFNLFVINAICILAIPEGDVRKIKQYDVFIITAVTSVLAYIWLLFILVGPTPDYITVWEALATLFAFPLLVWLSYLADTAKLQKCFRKRRIEPTVDARISRWSNVRGIRRSATGTVNKLLGMAKTSHDYTLGPREALRVVQALAPSKAELTVEQLQLIGAALVPKTRAQRRRMALGFDRAAVRKAHLQAKAEETLLKLRRDVLRYDKEDEKDKSVRFECLDYAVQEDAGFVEIGVVRETGLHKIVSVAYATRDGSTGDAAVAGSDYEPAVGKLTFLKGEKRKTIKIKIIDDDEEEPDEFFEVALSTPVEGTAVPTIPRFNWEVGHRCNVLIIDNDGPGVLRWQTTEPKYADAETQSVKLLVLREKGAEGVVSFNVKTVKGSAEPCKDYAELDERVTLKSGQVSHVVEVLLGITDEEEEERETYFNVEISDAQGGATIQDGSHITKIQFGRSEEQKKYMEQVATILNAQAEAAAEPETTYSEQILNAFKPNGGEGDTTATDWAWHAVSVFWKVLFATTPPPGLYGGWPCFFVALGWIGAVTLVISEAASIFGCVVGLADVCTAVTVVALGTSLPDTFASKAAAINDPTADASITNITGSNSVNVFLGLGLPWTMAAIYWTSLGCTGLYVPGADTLWVNVLVFVLCAGVCLGVLTWRRKFCGGELGGPKPARYWSAGLFVLLWVIYLFFGCWIA